MPFDILMNFTYGELVYYINYHREQSRKRLQEKSLVAYYQAVFTAKLISEGNIGEVFEEFPFWSEDEILDIRAEQAMNYFNNITNDN